MRYGRHNPSIHASVQRIAPRETFGTASFNSSSHLLLNSSPITMLTHPLAECVEKMLVGGRRLGAEERDAGGCDQTVRLLRLRRKRPRRRAAKRDYEFSSSDAHCHVTLRLGVMHAMEG